MVLVRCGADVNAIDDEGFTALHHCASLGKVEMMRFLIEVAGADVSCHTGASRESVLHLAANCESTTAIRYLISEDGADVHAVDAKSCTALHVAVVERKFEAVDFLIEKGADPAARDMNGRTPLHYDMIGSDNFDCWDHYDFSRLRHYDALFASVVNVPDSEGNTPLHLATTKNRRGYVLGSFFTWLVKDLGDLFALNQKGQTPLHVAAENGFIDTIRALVILILDTETPPWEELTESEERLRGMMEAKDSQGDTPLATAQKAGHGEQVTDVLTFP